MKDTKILLIKDNKIIGTFESKKAIEIFVKEFDIKDYKVMHVSSE